ncbi:Hypothetical protein A7982_09071 [Minicystis rosea]|nr:Hypothetical protein A7982_09071 [Minicystis rosea]
MTTGTGGTGTGGTTTASTTGTGGTGTGGSAPTCAPSFDASKLHLAAGASLGPGEERTMCLRWTAPEDIDISGIAGTLGAAGHHSLLVGRSAADEPDGLAPCSEAELMDAQTKGNFQMLAGVSYESSGVHYAFPAAPVQIGLRITKGTQLIFDAHFLNASTTATEACATLDLDRGKPVIVPLLFRTVVPVEQYGLQVPAHGSIDVAYDEPAGGSYRIAAASSHMHAGGTHFRMSIKETDQTLYETTQWADPEPHLFDTNKIVVQDGQTFRLECSFQNDGATPQHFPDQMCVGGMYLLTCDFPGAC